MASECRMPGCTIHGSGHVVNPIQAMLAGQRPWGWRDGTVGGVDGLDVMVDYLDGGSVQLWHHVRTGLAVGDPVRVHEGCVLLEISGRGWLSIKITRGGLGAIPEPEHPELWRAESTGAVVDLGDGSAFPV